MLEECSGDRFERLLLSLSTHALMKTSHRIPPDRMSALLRSQPAIYTSRLAEYHAVRQDWKRASSLVSQRDQDIQSVRALVDSQSHRLSPLYANFSTERLQLLAHSKLQELENNHWQGEGGRAALLFLTDLAGLRSSLSSPPSSSSSLCPKPSSSRPLVSTHPSPLPVAAAHHPAYLKKLRQPVFYSKASKHELAGPATHQTPAEILLAGRIHTRKQTRQVLHDALSRAKRRGEELRTISQSVARCQITEVTDIRLWTRHGATEPVSLEPEPSRELLFALGLGRAYEALMPCPGKDPVEKRIEQIRASILLPYPLIPDPHAARLPPREPADGGGPKSRIPLAKVSSHTKQGGGQLTKSDQPTLQVTLLQTPGISPSRSAASRSLRRKSLSVRFSMAQRRSGRPSVFRVFSGGMEDEVEKLIDETHDFPTDDDDTDHESSLASSAAKTPKAKRRTPKVNRIWTAGTPGRPPPVSKSRESVALADFIVDDDEDNVYGGGEATPMPAKRRLPRVARPPDLEDSEEGEGDDELFTPLRDEEEDVFGDDPPSMTLKDILLSADAGHFDLLEQGDEELEEGTLTEDVSFVWENSSTETVGLLQLGFRTATLPWQTLRKYEIRVDGTSTTQVLGVRLTDMKHVSSPSGGSFRAAMNDLSIFWFLVLPRLSERCSLRTYRTYVINDTFILGVSLRNIGRFNLCEQVAFAIIPSDVAKKVGSLRSSQWCVHGDLHSRKADRSESPALAPVGDSAFPDDYLLFGAADNDFISTHDVSVGIPFNAGLDVDNQFLVFRVTLPIKF
ncbi:hypothetical protein NLJ89_g4472 [Agrocybe chaxingu]|uniref:Uncharacterized protein n=1 Tax=Agrocybe chaxingu TaxID=84603 RepID=A0A9W8K2R8_9AGAR|nr:hypothetical protein NLJ89_g4472 [Agrocybe chaxingu]